MTNSKALDRSFRLHLPHIPSGLHEKNGDAAPSDYQAFEETQTFGEFPAMLEFRFRTGNRLALPYHWLGQAEFNPSLGITLDFSTGASVAIRGRNLSELFAAVTLHQVRWIREVDQPTAKLWPENLPLVESMQVEAKGSLRGK